MSEKAPTNEEVIERYLTPEDGVKIWQENKYSFVATPLPGEGDYRKVVRTRDDDIERVWKRSRVKVQVQDGKEIFTIERRRITGKHEALFAAAATVGAVAVGVYEYKKHKKD